MESWTSLVSFAILLLTAGDSTTPLTNSHGRGSAQTQARARRAEVHEDNLRKMATSKSVPIYPRTALAKKLRGIVVAQIEADPEGSVTRVNILESAAPAFSDAVTAAVRKWSWPPTAAQKSGAVVSITGRLTFYFDIVDGKGIVREPDEMKSVPPGKSPAVRPPSDETPLPPTPPIPDDTGEQGFTT